MLRVFNGLCAFAALFLSIQPVQAAENVSFTTADGFVIKGDYQPPATAGKTVVLLHGLGSNRQEWEPLEKALAAKGYGYFAYDARGHGDSDLKNGQKVTYQSFGRLGRGSEWSRMPDDLAAAVRFLVRTKKLQERSIIVGGASLGANVSLVYAASHRMVPAIILLSPGLEYAGIATDSAIKEFNDRPILLAASPNDRYAYESCSVLYRSILRNKRALFIQGKSGHGTQMFDGAMEQRIISWLASTREK